MPRWEISSGAKATPSRLRKKESLKYDHAISPHGEMACARSLFAESRPKPAGGENGVGESGA